MIAGGAWADRWRRAGNRAPVWVGVIGIVVTIPCVLLAANTGQLAVVVAALAIYGVVRAFPDANMMPILCQIVDAPYRATAMGLLNGFASLIGGGVIYAGGALRDANVNVRIVFDIGAAGLLVCAILLWLIRPPVRASPIPKSAVTVDCA
jgi:sugar phosphate permease